MRNSLRQKFSLLLAIALLASALVLPVRLGGGAAAQGNGNGNGRQKQKSFGYRPQNVSVKGQGAAARSLTGPNSGKARDIALGHLKQNRGQLGLAEEDLAELKVTDEYTSAHNGVTHVYLRQQIDGIEVVGAEGATNIARDGKVINLHSSFVKGLRGAANRRAPALSPVEAVNAAAAHLGLTITEPLAIVEAEGGAARRTVFNKAGISYDPINAKLVYQPVDADKVRLAWSVEIHELSGEHWWNLSVDAETGEVLAGDDLVDSDNWGENFAPDVARNRSFLARAAAAPAARRAAAPAPPVTVNDGSGYNVFAIPFESPYDGARTLVTNPADALSSPFGWHDTNGAAGPEFTVTRGNNVHAYTDVDDNNVVDPGSDPNGGPTLQFNFPWDDTTTQPAGYRPAAVTNLFYWNNIVHDVFYRYGFDEVSGNFQVNNYGRGPTVAPLGNNDDVRAEAQDGSGTNNANFGTGTDGQRPRMQMFVWTYPFSRAVTVNSPASIAGTYIASTAAFGPAINANLTGDVELVNDGDGSTSDACQPLVGFTAGRIALLDRGSCDFVVKVKNAQNAGAVAAIVVNNVPGEPITMGGADATITIPSLMVEQTTGNLIKANPPVNATLGINPNPPPNRDSDFDAGVIAHEYGHGISNRLTGGRIVTGCLNNQEQMGEGWSDFTGLVLTTDPLDTATTARGVGTYVSFQSPTTGRGIRPAPYTTDMVVNPATYDTIKTAAVPHGVGYVWASMLWEMYWNLVGEHGYNPNVYDSWQTGGNNLAIQLVIDGMKLQPCRPGFVDGRNAILQADQQLTGGENECLIWKAFAKRGLGFSANQGSNLSRADGTQAFDLPAICRADIGVVPPSLSETLTPNTQSSQQLIISNGSKEDGEDLSWTITEAASDCSMPSDVTWLSASPTSGTTAADSSSNVAVGFDSTGLAIGTYTAKLCIASNDGSMPTTEVPVTLDVNYLFSGFFPPVANAPTLNNVNSGQTIPLHFTLNGSFGLNIFAAGFPASRQVDCTTLAPLGGFTPTETPGNSGLSSSASGYNYPWKTNKAWANTCRELVVRTNDNTDHNAYFNFRK